MLYKNEILKDIDQQYCISNFGRVFSKHIDGIRKDGLPQKRGYKELVQTLNNNGYPTVRINKVIKTVHRLVAKAFIPNDLNKPQVNHINHIKYNNYVENLEWTTKEENMQHAHLNGLMKLPKGNSHHYFKIKSDLHPRAKSLINTETKEIYGCIKDCAKVLNIKEGTLRGWLSEPRINPTKIIYIDDYKNNNGWIKIESEDDLKLARGYYWFKWNSADGEENVQIAIVDNKGINLYQEPTHYQPIVKPLKPLH